MRAGLLQERIKIMRPQVVTNDVGEQITVYTAGNFIYARDVTFRQMRQLDNGEIWMPASKTIEVRIYQDVQDYDLIQWNGKQFRIVSIETDRPQQLKRLTLDEINDAVTMATINTNSNA